MDELIYVSLKIRSIMKKIFMLATLFAALTFSGCGGDFKGQSLSLLEDYTAAIEKAETMDDLEAAGKEYKRAMEDLDEKMDKEMTKEEQDKLKEELREDKEYKRAMEDAMENMFKALKKKRDELRDKE